MNDIKDQEPISIEYLLQRNY